MLLIAFLIQKMVDCNIKKIPQPILENVVLCIIQQIQDFWKEVGGAGQSL